MKMKLYLHSETIIIILINNFKILRMNNMIKIKVIQMPHIQYKIKIMLRTKNIFYIYIEILNKVTEK